jgi:S-adenosylmethionine:tRNA ribosyltransferase-isomerase
MEIDDFDYDLPANLIAQQPPKVRGDSKLLIVNPNKSSKIDSHCKNFYDYLSPKDLLVFNDTKVIKARLFGEKVTGGKVELLIENIIDPNHALTMIKTSKKIPSLVLALPIVPQAISFPFLVKSLEFLKFNFLYNLEA